MFTSSFPILNGDKKNGVTFHRIDASIDTGEIIDQKSFEIKNMDCREIYLNYIKIGSEVVLRNMETVLQDNERSHPQKRKNFTYYPRHSIDYNNITIDLNQTAAGIARKIVLTISGNISCQKYTNIE